MRGRFFGAGFYAELAGNAWFLSARHGEMRGKCGDETVAFSWSSAILEGG
jgi:hypothetical protein